MEALIIGLTIALVTMSYVVYMTIHMDDYKHVHE